MTLFLVVQGVALIVFAALAPLHGPDWKPFAFYALANLSFIGAGIWRLATVFREQEAADVPTP